MKQNPPSPPKKKPRWNELSVEELDALPKEECHVDNISVGDVILGRGGALWYKDGYLDDAIYIVTEVQGYKPGWNGDPFLILTMKYGIGWDKTIDSYGINPKGSPHIRLVQVMEYDPTKQEDAEDDL